MVSECFYDNRQAGGGKKPDMTPRLRYSLHLIRHHLGNLFYKCPSQWKCFSWNFLLFNVSQAINHETQTQMKPALSALELLITKSQENAFQGNYFSS